ncbi:hypothetical protein EmuJ_000335100 [Echinococcus multilocularis]|uniref:Uncharacterized protein n=1 Tax=Echinococcus multilocularis TaxID=6211 RepID=A0A068XVJ4_ECHMU|nr:hypothetical protein EmuJ_000335100 [Echinococcus multilocularis]
MPRSRDSIRMPASSLKGTLEQPSQDFPEDERRHNTRVEYIYLAQGRRLGHWHGPQAGPPSEVEVEPVRTISSS